MAREGCEVFFGGGRSRVESVRYVKERQGRMGRKVFFWLIWGMVSLGDESGSNSCVKVGREGRVRKRL